MDWNIKELLLQSKNWLLSSGLRIILIVIIGMIAYRLVGPVARRIIGLYKTGRPGGEMEKRAKTLSSFLRAILSIAVLVIVFVMILGEFGVEIGPILAAAGIVGIAIGFGSQRLVEDVISGFFILMEDQARVGDVIQTAGHGGVVENVTLRMIILRDLAGNVHFIRNGKIDTITNMTKEFSQYVFDIGVAYRENVDEVIEVIKEVGEYLKNDPEFSEDILEPLEVLGVDQFADSAVIIKARFKTKPIKQWRVAREFNRRLKNIFDEKGIEIPYPHLTVYPGQGKDKTAPPLHIIRDGQ